MHKGDTTYSQNVDRLTTHTSQKAGITNTQILDPDMQSLNFQEDDLKMATAQPNHELSRDPAYSTDEIYRPKRNRVVHTINNNSTKHNHEL